MEILDVAANLVNDDQDHNFSLPWCVDILLQGLEQLAGLLLRLPLVVTDVEISNPTATKIATDFLIDPVRYSSEPSPV